jgi:hypothetical protein
MTKSIEFRWEVGVDVDAGDLSTGDLSTGDFVTGDFVTGACVTGGGLETTAGSGYNVTPYQILNLPEYLVLEFVLVFC